MLARIQKKNHYTVCFSFKIKSLKEICIFQCLSYFNLLGGVLIIQEEVHEIILLIEQFKYNSARMKIQELLNERTGLQLSMEEVFVLQSLDFVTKNIMLLETFENSFQI